MSEKDIALYSKANLTISKRCGNVFQVENVIELGKIEPNQEGLILVGGKPKDGSKSICQIVIDEVATEGKISRLQLKLRRRDLIFYDLVYCAKQPPVLYQGVTKSGSDLDIKLEDGNLLEFGEFRIQFSDGASSSTGGASEADKFDFRLDENRLELYYKQQPVKLTKREFILMAYLYNHYGKLCSREELLNELNRAGYVTQDEGLNVLMYSLKTKISDLGKMLKIVKTAGYRFEFDK